MNKGATAVFKKLFEPGFIGKLRLKNRLIRASMYTTYGALDGSVTDRLIRHYRELAAGGVGLVIVEESHVDRKSSKSAICELSVAGDEYIPGLSWLAMTIKQNGARAGLQISHAGGQRYLMDPLKKVPSSAPWAAIQARVEAITGRVGTPPSELTVEEIKEIIEAFGDAAVRAQKASFDFVEIHACHGYLLTEFLSPLTNKRTDQYGGSLENRQRILMEIIENVRKKVRPDYPLIVRMDGSEYLEGGITIQESVETAKVLEKSGINALHISGGDHRNADKVITPTYWPRGYQVWAAATIKGVVKIPVIASGSVTTPELAEEILKEGKADFISLARPLLADPFFPKKAQEGRPEDITPCIRCLVGCQGRPEGSLTCTVNVTAGKEDELTIKRAVKRKKVAVIGGGPAGMEAARVAAIMGHQVTLFEKREMGGMLIEASIPEFKADLRLLINHLSKQLEKHKVEVLHEEADVEAIRRKAFEVVIMAGGGTPIIPRISGIDKPCAVNALDVLNGVPVGEEVVVLGGGFVGCETALFLAEQGKKVTIVEMRDQLLPEVDVVANRLAFFEKAMKHHMKFETSTKVNEIAEHGCIATNQEGNQKNINGETFVHALGIKTDRKLFDELTSSLPDLEVYMIGDYAEPRNLYHALREGNLTARNL